MSVLSPPAPAPAPAHPPVAPRRVPKTSRAKLLGLGIALVALMLGVVVVVLQSFGGTFSSYDTVEAELPATSTAVALGAPVEYRDVQVGTVASQGRSAPGGLVVITLRIDPSSLAAIPAGVAASETPVSVFGDPYVVLEPPSRPGTATLRAGSTIPALETGQTASLQATLGDLDSLLVGLHPAELDAALTAMAGALQGQGTSLGQNIDRGNSYLTKMLPLWPTVVADLKTLVPVSGQLAAATPDLLAILANQSVTGRTIDTEAAALHQALGGGAQLSSEAAQLLTAIEQPYEILAADAGPFLQDISQSPTEISQLLAGLDAWAKSWTAAEGSGPYLDLTTDVSVANPADLGLAVLGGPEVAQYLSAGLGAGYVDPTTYSSAGTIGGASTTAAGARAADLARAIASASPAVMTAGTETAAVSQIVSAMTGARPRSAAVSSLLLSPVLSGLVAGR